MQYNFVRYLAFALRDGIIVLLFVTVWLRGGSVGEICIDACEREIPQWLVTSS
jgi:hypothetical protein